MLTVSLQKPKILSQLLTAKDAELCSAKGSVGPLQLLAMEFAGTTEAGLSIELTGRYDTTELATRPSLTTDVGGVVHNVPVLPNATV